ncbi:MULTISPECIES: DUF871 domain-containing protein [unclassified Lactobacillus]|uniref:DUF871 domain-containing protein n=1 Tax=unclassified Lactobacillus TaxID=2620435 RepID=UPI000EFA76C3|nr:MULTISPECIES: MupG family TIM beta-alpha barrel fold protein [unclassified Lactobacillus]RMC23657.1 DUF871 domain-containing protein [Lactobacillus sp. ESL0247]RMC27417.1 DUF871 domain-containing protein [Lactobacillus sp. ESL0246]RMC30618.1 DUF871 domain-containing protein [Lactobacillus sp. ESL0245]
MKQLGISLYPEQSTFEQDKTYMDLAKKYGYQRIFSSLLQLKSASGIDLLARLKEDVTYANQLGFKTIVDINPVLFKELKIDYHDLKFFHELGVWGLRLDEGFSGSEEAAMTHNPYGLKIELNMSRGTNYLDSIMSYDPEIDNLIGCHNFYPQEYTGLSETVFIEYSQKYRDYGLHTAAFISSKQAKFGPWPVHEGLPTIESDRKRNIFSQVTHLRLSKMIDDIIIGNAFASEEELSSAAEAFNSPFPMLGIKFEQDVLPIERTICLKKPHLYRGDASEYLLRDTEPRVVYSDKEVAAQAEVKTTFDYGDIVVVNEKYPRYKGEMQVVLKPFENDGRRNLVGRIIDDDLDLLDEINPWSTFILHDVN